MLLNRLQNLMLRLRGRPIMPSGIRIGRGVQIGANVRFDWSHGRHITIDDDAVLVDGARILCHDASSYGRLGITRVAPVHIGRRAFIGFGALIMPGVTVGTDAVVGAGAVVTNDVADGTVVAGVPAVLLGQTRDLDAKRFALLASSRVFDESLYNVHPLQPKTAAELDAAASTGGYWLARRDVARRFARS